MKFAGGPAALSQNQDRGLSPVIWDNFKLNEMRHNPSIGSWWFDDYLHMNQTTASNVIKAQTGAGSYIGYITTSNTLHMSNAFLPGDKTKANGVIEFTTTAAANSVVSIEAGDGNGGAWGITGNNYPKLAYECRVYLNQTLVTNYNLFFGLAEKGLGVIVGTGSIFQTSTPNTLNQKSMIGFYVASAAPANILPVYGKNGSAPVSPVNGVNAGVGTLKSKAWTKLGFIYDPFPHDAFSPPGLLKFYQDGVLLGWVTDCSVAAFPTATLLTPLVNVAANNAGTATVIFDLDWQSLAVQIDA